MSINFLTNTIKVQNLKFCTCFANENMKNPSSKVGCFSKIAEIFSTVGRLRNIPNLKFCFIKIAHRTTFRQCLWAAAAHSWRTQSFAPKMAGRDSFMGVYLANLQPHHIQKVVRVYIYSGRSRGVSNDPNS